MYEVVNWDESRIMLFVILGYDVLIFSSGIRAKLLERGEFLGGHALRRANGYDRFLLCLQKTLRWELMML